MLPGGDGGPDPGLRRADRLHPEHPGVDQLQCGPHPPGVDGAPRPGHLPGDPGGRRTGATPHRVRDCAGAALPPRHPSPGLSPGPAHRDPLGCGGLRAALRAATPGDVAPGDGGGPGHAGRPGRRGDRLHHRGGPPGGTGPRRWPPRADHHPQWPGDRPLLLRRPPLPRGGLREPPEGRRGVGPGHAQGDASGGEPPPRGWEPPRRGSPSPHPGSRSPPCVGGADGP